MIVISILMTCLCGIALASSKSQMFQQIVNKTSTATPLEKLAFTNPGVCQVSDTKLTTIFNETLYIICLILPFSLYPKFDHLLTKRRF